MPGLRALQLGGSPWDVEEAEEGHRAGREGALLIHPAVFPRGSSLLISIFLFSAPHTGGTQLIALD